MCGEVVAQMYRDDKMPSFMVAPYQVKLDDDQGTRSGTKIYVPVDDNRAIRKLEIPEEDLAEVDADVRTEWLTTEDGARLELARAQLVCRTVQG